MGGKQEAMTFLGLCSEACQFTEFLQNMDVSLHAPTLYSRALDHQQTPKPKPVLSPSGNRCHWFPGSQSTARLKSRGDER